MCSHYQIKDKQRALSLARSKAETTEPVEVAFPENAWPGARMPVVVQMEKRTLTTMRWGVRPPFGKQLVSNARDDKLLKSVLWKQSARTRRCLAVADAWLEWRGPKGSRAESRFTFRDGHPFWIAALWAPDPFGDERGFTLVTSSPNPLVAALPHDRMIVLLDDEAAAKWLGTYPLPDDELLRFCRPFPDTDLEREDFAPPKRKPKDTVETLDLTQDSPPLL